MGESVPRRGGGAKETTWWRGGGCEGEEGRDYHRFCCSYPEAPDALRYTTSSMTRLLPSLKHLCETLDMYISLLGSLVHLAKLLNVGFGPKEHAEGCVETKKT